MNMVELSQRLKSLRMEREMTLEEVASHAGLTRGWLSKVENFRVTPSLPALSKIADALGVTMAELFEDLDSRPKLVVVRKEDRQIRRRDEEISDLVYESLAFPRPAREMDPFILTIPSGSERPALSHAGEEFMLALSGTTRLDHGEDAIVLSEGDSAYFDGNVPHRVICQSEKASKVLIVYWGIAHEDLLRDTEAMLRGES